MTTQDAFQAALGVWRSAALNLAEKKTAYARAHAEALANAPGKSAGDREAHALLATVEQKHQVELATIDERCAYFLLQFMLREASKPADALGAAA